MKNNLKNLMIGLCMGWIALSSYAMAFDPEAENSYLVTLTTVECKKKNGYVAEYYYNIAGDFSCASGETNIAYIDLLTPHLDSLVCCMRKYPRAKRILKIPKIISTSNGQI